MLEPRKLRMLVELADHGTISAAADALHYTPSTVSHGLSSLEEDVGVALLERSARSVRLTSAADALVADSREILSRLAAARVGARFAGGLERGEVRIATFPSAGSLIVAPTLERLQLERPSLPIRLLDAEPAEALNELRSGNVDVAVVYCMGFADSLGEDFDLTLLAEDPMRQCASPEIAGARRGDVELSRFKGQPFAAGRGRSPCHAFTIEACRRAGFVPEVTYETDDISFIGSLVNSNLAAALMPQALLATSAVEIPTYSCEPLLPPRQIYAARRVSSARLQVAADVVASLKESAAQLVRPAEPLSSR